jgi:hypothetical protein
VAFGAQHGRDGGRIHTARHGYRDGVVNQLLAPGFWPNLRRLRSLGSRPPGGQTYVRTACFLYAGLSSLSRATVSGTSARAKSISSAVVCLPRLNRMLALA